MKILNFLLPSLILITISALTGCVSNFTLQTAKAIPEGQLDIGMIMATTTNRAAYDMQNEHDENSHSPFIPFTEIPENTLPSGRLGLGHKIDAALILNPYPFQNLPIEIGGDIKYQFFNAGNFYSASGLGFFYMNNYKDIVDDNQHGELFLPVYVSYNLFDKFNVYGAVKGVYRFRRNEVFEDGSWKKKNRYTQLVNYTVGYMRKTDSGNTVFIETAYQYEFQTKFSSYQVNYGIFTSLNLW